MLLGLLSGGITRTKVKCSILNIGIEEDGKGIFTAIFVCWVCPLHGVQNAPNSIAVSHVNSNVIS